MLALGEWRAWWPTRVLDTEDAAQPSGLAEMSSWRSAVQ